MQSNGEAGGGSQSAEKNCEISLDIYIFFLPMFATWL